MMSEVTNEQRIAWANQEIEGYAALTNQELGNFERDNDILLDLLTDLMHWAESHGIDFESRLHYSRLHYQHERKENNQLPADLGE